MDPGSSALYQATVVSTEGVPLENLSPPEQIDTQSQITILEQLKEVESTSS
ncbi:MAG: hypothetical protein U0V70_05010 [Terriglobia bacterium]